MTLRPGCRRLLLVGFGDGFRLLLVDDDDGVRDVLGDVLAGTGFAVDLAADLKSARECVDSRAYDLLVVDKNLPDGSGLEIARYLGERDADCEIILITAHGTKESAFEAFELGLSDVVPKPFDNMDDVRARVRKALERLGGKRRARARRLGPANPSGTSKKSTESERRMRFFVELRVRFILVDGSLTGAAFVSQLSTTDLFVESDRPLPLGTCVRMRLYLPRVGVADVRGVVRRHGDGQSMLGMRVEFTDLTEEQLGMIRAYLEPKRKTLGFTASPSFAPPVEEPGLGDRFTPDALRLFVGMHGGKILDFIETLDAATVEAILDQRRAGIEELESPAPGKTPAPFEMLPPALFDPENADPEELPLVMGSGPAEPTEPADEEERIRAKYRLNDELLDDTVRRKYAIDDSLFDEKTPEPKPKPDAPKAAPATGEVLNKIGANPDQRRAFAAELRRRGEEALSRGLLFKALSDLALAVAFDATDPGLQEVYERVRTQSNRARAEDLYRQGLQQMALGDGDAAAKLLLSATELAPETKHVIAAVRVLLHTGGEEAATQCRSLLRDAIARDGDNADLHVLNGRAAEAAGFPKAAQRSYQRALELKPDHDAAKELLSRIAG